MVNVLVAIWGHSFLTLPLTAQKVFVSEFNQNNTYHIMSYYDVFSHMEIKFFHNLLFCLVWVNAIWTNQYSTRNKNATRIFQQI